MEHWRSRGIAAWGDASPSGSAGRPLEGDGDIDQTDLGVLLAAYGVDEGGDLNCDGLTDQADLGILLSEYGCDS